MAFLFNLNYGMASSVAVDPIEKKAPVPFSSRHTGFLTRQLGLQFSLPGLSELANLDGEGYP